MKKLLLLFIGCLLGATSLLAASSDATLKAITVSNGTLSPTFNSTTYNYSVQLSAGTTVVPTVTVTTNNIGAKDTINTVTTILGGTTTTVIVTAADGTTTKTYTITYTLASLSDASLKSLSINNGALSPAFNANTFTYSVLLPAGTTAVPTVAAVADTSVANVVTSKATALPGTTTVTVTSQDGEVKNVYTLNFVAEITGVTVTDSAVIPHAITTIGGTLQMLATVTPEPVDPVLKELVWTVSNDTIATVDLHSGLLTALRVGTVMVYGDAKDGSGLSDSEKVTVFIPVDSINIDMMPSTTTAGALQMLATTFPSNAIYPSSAKATHTTVTWSVSDTIAKIDSKGVLTTKKPGNVVITATANDLSKYSKSYSLTIVPIAGPSSPSLIKTIGGTLQLTATLPDNIDPKLNTLKWLVSDTVVTKIDSTTGLVTAKNFGREIVSAYSKDTSGIFGIDTVIIDNPVTSISISSSTLINKVDSVQTQLTANISPQDATTTTVTWSIVNPSNPPTASIDKNGLLTVKKNGKVVFKATSNDNYFATSAMDSITIAEPNVVTAIALDTATIINKIGMWQMVTNVSPKTATDTTVTWSVADPSTAAIDSTGILIAKTAGTIVIIATAKDISKLVVYDTINIKKTGLVTKITLDTSATTLAPGVITVQMGTTIAPTFANDKSVTWSVSVDTTVATIDSTGLLTVFSKSKITVTATANDLSGKTGTISLTFADVPAGVGIVRSFFAIYPNPTSGELTINTEGLIKQVDILNALGLVVTSVTGQTKLSIANLASGFYIVRVTTADGNVFVKSIIKK